VFLLQGDLDTGLQKILSDAENTEVPPPVNNLVLDHMLQLPGLDKEMILKVKLESGIIIIIIILLSYIDPFRFTQPLDVEIVSGLHDILHNLLKQETGNSYNIYEPN
jgi:hypothetical protein